MIEQGTQHKATVPDSPLPTKVSNAWLFDGSTDCLARLSCGVWFVTSYWEQQPLIEKNEANVEVQKTTGLHYL